MYKSYAVLGNPIIHSQSPKIHLIFAKQLGIKINYEKIEISSNNFSFAVNNFFKKGGIGANISAPFKIEAYKLVEQLTNRAKISGSVNVLKRIDNFLLGDNTDGIGLISDLKRLKLIKPKENVLIIGAGGAARGIIPKLLQHNIKVVVTNRTYERAKFLVDIFKKYGDIKCCNLSNLGKYRYDLIINATSSSSTNTIPTIPTSIIESDTKCYDLFYSHNLTPFLNWCKEHGAKFLADGFGMLIEQAAYSFHFWFGRLPDTKPVFKKLRKNHKI